MKSQTKNKAASSKITAGQKTTNESDNALISVLEKLPVGVIIFSSKKIVFANKPAIKVLKPNKNQEKTITEHSIFDFLLPEYHKRIKSNNKKLLDGEVFIPAELKIRNYKNEIIDIEVKSNVIVFNGQNVIQTVFTEVSERVKYTEELTHYKENLEHITENANDIIFFYTYHPKPKYIYISPSIKKVLGYTSQDFYKDSLLGSKIVADKVAYKKFEDKLSKLQKSNTLKHTSILFQYKTRSGKMIWLEDNYSPIYENDGTIKFILGISRDVTREKTYQLELEHKWNNYQNLLDTSPIGIFIHDNGICLYCNQTALTILEEKDSSKVIGKNLIGYILPEFREPAIKRMNRAFKGEELSDESYKIRTAKKKVIDVELKTVPFIYNGKKCVQTIISNISAEKLLAKETLRAELAEDLNKQLLAEINYRKKIEHE